MRTTFHFSLWLASGLVPICCLAQEQYKPDSLLQVLDKSKGRDSIEVFHHLSCAYFRATNTNFAMIIQSVI